GLLDPLNRARTVILGEEKLFKLGSRQVETAEGRRPIKSACNINIPVCVHANPAPGVPITGSATGLLRPLERAGGIVFGHEDVLPSDVVVGQGDAAQIVRAIEPPGYIAVAIGV